MNRRDLTNKVRRRELSLRLACIQFDVVLIAKNGGWQLPVLWRTPLFVQTPLDDGAYTYRSRTRSTISLV